MRDDDVCVFVNVKFWVLCVFVDVNEFKLFIRTVRAKSKAKGCKGQNIKSMVCVELLK